MPNISDVPLTIRYTRPRIRDWKQLRYLFDEQFPDISRSEVAYLIRDGMNKMIVARRDNQVLGFGYFVPLSPQKLHLLYLLVGKDYLRQGIASQLLVHIEDYAITHGYNAIVLSVEHDNQVAKRFYETQGYRMTNNRNADNKESWRKELSGTCTGPVIQFGLWSKDIIPGRVIKKALYRLLINR